MPISRAGSINKHAMLLTGVATMDTDVTRRLSALVVRQRAGQAQPRCVMFGSSWTSR
jgi:hypothetical protein